MTTPAKIEPWVKKLAQHVMMVLAHNTPHGPTEYEQALKVISSIIADDIAAHAPDEGCFKSTEPRGPVVIEISKLSKVCADAMRQIELVIMNYRTTGENLLNITFDGQRDLPPEFFLTGKTIILRHIREFLEHAATE